MYDYSDLISVANEEMQEAYGFYRRAVEAEKRGNEGAARMFNKRGDELAEQAANLFERVQNYNWKHLPRWWFDYDFS